MEHIVGLAVIEGNLQKRRIALLSGGVGGARLARGLAQIQTVDLTVVVNVGDDDEIYGLCISPDLDTVLYTLAGAEGPDGWGVRGDTFRVLDRLAAFGIDTEFRIGDLDFAVHLCRTMQLRKGLTLSVVTDQLRKSFGVGPVILPASNEPIRTKVKTDDGWLAFQDYFVARRHRDRVTNVRFDGAAKAAAAPGVEHAIRTADLVVIGPSNPPLSIWPVLAVPDIALAVEAAPRVMAISPLFGGKALKGPADRVLESLGFPPGNEGVAAAYEDILSDFVIDTDDAADADRISSNRLRVHVADTRIAATEPAARFGSWLAELA